MARQLHRYSLIAATACLLLAGCSSGNRDFAYHAIDEIPQGAGLLTDETGEFTIVKWDPSKRSNPTDTASVPSPAPAQPQPQTVVSTSGITEAATPE